MDYENEFEKEIFYAINMLRWNPKSFVPHVQRVHTKGLNKLPDGKQSRQMPKLIELLKTVNPCSTVKFDDGCNAAVRNNNVDLCGENAVEKPEAGGNLDMYRELQQSQDPKGFEYSFFKYEGNSAEEFVALLLYQDFDRQDIEKAKQEAPKDGEQASAPPSEDAQAASQEPAAAKVEAADEEVKPGLLDESVTSVGISNKAHAKCTNSIQVILLCSSVNQMM